MKLETVYGLVNGYNLHFKNLKFNVLTYGIEIATIKSGWSKLSDSGKTKYQWLQWKYPLTEDLLRCIIGCQIDMIDVRYENRETINESYLKFRGRRERMTYQLKQDHTFIESFDDKSVTKALKFCFVGKISPEYCILRYYETGELLKAYNDPMMAYCAERILRIIKYREFFPSYKFQSILEKDHGKSTTQS